jgi:hypothetical protein
VNFFYAHNIAGRDRGGDQGRPVRHHRPARRDERTWTNIEAEDLTALLAHRRGRDKSKCPYG